MATQNQKIYSIKIDGLDKEIKSMSQLQETAKELEAQLETSELGSDNFEKLRKQLVQTRGEIGKIDESLTTMSSAERAENLFKIGEGLAGGFAIATVASSAFGEKTAEQIQKAQATALNLVVALDGVKKITEGATSAYKLFGQSALANFKLAGVGAKSFSTTTRIALAATGIGLFVVALGAVVAYWEDLTKWITDSIKPLKEFSDRVGGISGAFKIAGEIAKAVFKNIGEAALALVRGEFKQAIEEIQEISSDSQAAIDKQITRVAQNRAAELRKMREEQYKHDEKLRKESIESAIKEKERILSIEKAKKKDVEKLQLEIFELKKSLYKADSDEYKQVETDKTIFLIEQEQARIDAINTADQKRLDELKKNAENTKKVLSEGSDLPDIFGIPDEKEIDPRLQKLNKLMQDKFLPGLKEIVKKNNETLSEDEDTPSLLEGLFGVSEDAELEDKIAAIGTKVLEGYDQIASAITTSLDRQIERSTRKLDQLTESQSQSIQKITALEQQADAAKGARKDQIIGLIDKERKREEFLAKQKIEQEKKIQEAEKKRAIADKIRAISSSIINTAVGVTQALPNVVLAAIVGAMGAVQTGIIAKQKFAKGGLLKGKSHREGGINVINTNSGQMVEAEGEEYFINRQATANNLHILDRINREGKRKKFKIYADGGLNEPDFQTINNSLSSGISTGDQKDIKVNVGINEFNRTNNRVKELERTASL
ncbi:hypothetical protein OKW21_006050 [Catalinimonas alkaloidigena]|uniref:hypothetical protein n=1 Tax=Catalinimonas alkaloidigena TaxID=1075417 RepID=UPI0024059E04|nr:hypothetical protein [Catalinimonas alkaloidigena]MDF9800787.1 hypothetical protein [Catalinimonas alkaloidigena]